jgi:hypothetical protein
MTAHSILNTLKFFKLAVCAETPATNMRKCTTQQTNTSQPASQPTPQNCKPTQPQHNQSFTRKRFVLVWKLKSHLSWDIFTRDESYLHGCWDTLARRKRRDEHGTAIAHGAAADVISKSPADVGAAACRDGELIDVIARAG